MVNAFIFHGSNGNPEKHWYPWLKNKLKENNHNVFIPQFPIEDNQKLENWFNTIDPLKKYLENSILIGHSLGVPFILNLLNKFDYKIKSSFLVSGFVGHLEVEDEPNIGDFSEREFEWEKIKSNCGKFYVIHSDNDPYIPIEKADELAKHLEVHPIIIADGGHFQGESGYETFDILLDMIEGKFNK